MTTVPRSLDYEILIGCSWVAVRPEHVRKGDVFRVLRRDGSAYKVALRVLPDVDDSGVYVAARDGSESGVMFEVVQAVTVLMAPVVDLEQ